MNDAANPGALPRNELSEVLIGLLKAFVYREQSPQLWREIVHRQGAARDHLRLLGLDLVIDDVEGYCYFKQVETRGGSAFCGK